MLERVDVSSASTTEGRQGDFTASELHSRIASWRAGVTPEQAHRLFDIVETFGIDAYDRARLVARPEYLHFAGAIST